MTMSPLTKQSYSVACWEVKVISPTQLKSRALVETYIRMDWYHDKARFTNINEEIILIHFDVIYPLNLLNFFSTILKYFGKILFIKLVALCNNYL